MQLLLLLALLCFQIIVVHIAWLHYPAHAPEKEELAYVSASRVVELEKVQLMPESKRSRVSVKSKVNLILFTRQSKYLVSQSFDLGRRSEYMIYQSATPLF